MKRFEILEHTADGKFRAFGKSREEQFSNAVSAVFSFMFEAKVASKVEKEININAKDEKALLYKWIEEFLYLLDADSFLPAKVKEIKISKSKGVFMLNAVVLGDASNKYKSVGSVKAVTYAEMELGTDFVQVVVDL
jgi:SHS2 domain-containing protein